MSWDLIILVASLFAFIISMIMTLRDFFGTTSRWFPVLLLCVLVSGACMVMELHRFLAPPVSPELPRLFRPMPSPL